MRSLIIFFLLFSLNAQTEEPTHLIWIANNGTHSKSQCYLVDTKTNGENYKVNVKNIRCKPTETDYLFVSRKSTCYIVDQETGGKKYIEEVKTDKCKPDDTLTYFTEFNGTTGCFILDKKSKGEYFHKRLSDKSCKEQWSDKNNFYFQWEYIKQGKGNCFKVIQSNGKEIPHKVRSTKCRTSKSHFIFVREKRLSGICIEEDNNPKRYSDKTKIDKCKPQNTAFMFYKEKRAKLGKCYEVDIETQGDLYINTVDSELCKPE